MQINLKKQCLPKTRAEIVMTNLKGYKNKEELKSGHDMEEMRQRF